ncbi:hypothetical protein HAX54_033118 [Datura stramonium]|uniref:Uncharacterized protein n=1 Tax=Datura stramonium TaxID=4076 RepID=A0ABS8VDB7_DATST|nr:hypothetical protein [Datura stramonium]
MRGARRHHSSATRGAKRGLRCAMPCAMRQACPAAKRISFVAAKHAWRAAHGIAQQRPRVKPLVTPHAPHRVGVPSCCAVGGAALKAPVLLCVADLEMLSTLRIVQGHVALVPACLSRLCGTYVCASR